MTRSRTDREAGRGPEKRGAGSNAASSQIRSRRVALGGALAALALIFSYVEVLIPFGFGVPGIKLGLANIVVVIAVFALGPSAGVTVNLVRIAMAALLFGNMYSAVYSLAGGLLSLAVMLLLKRSGKFRVTGISMGGGFFHNLGQLLAACVFSGTPRIFYYLPILGLSGILTGAVNGVIAALVLEKAGILKES